MTEQRTALYRLLAANGRLLYVGISATPDSRWASHAQRKGWWSQVADRKLEWFETRPEALLAEAVAIREERPLHNVQHSALWMRGELDRRAAAIVGSLRYEDGQVASHEEGFLLVGAVANALADGWTKWEILANFAENPRRRLPLAERTGIRWAAAYREQLWQDVCDGHADRCGQCAAEGQVVAVTPDVNVEPFPQALPTKEDKRNGALRGIPDFIVNLSNARVLELVDKLQRESPAWYEVTVREIDQLLATAPIIGSLAEGIIGDEGVEHPGITLQEFIERLP